MKRRLAAMLLLPAAAAAAFLLLRESGLEDRPNILLITLDTTRADHLSCYGYGRKTTPNLDRLASEGRRFENMVAVSSWTLPTHASLFTGLFPSTHGAHFAEKGAVSLDQAIRDEAGTYADFRVNALPAEAVTLAEILKAAGYATGGIGSGPWLKTIFGLAQGFDEYDCEVHSTPGRQEDKVTDLAIPFLDRHQARPFFLFLTSFDPHAPWDPPPDLRFRFFPEEKLPLVQVDEAVAKEFDISQYDAEILYMDRELGRLFNILKNMGLFDSTWIIVTSDHGELLGEHGLWWHGFSLFEGEIRCPLIMKWPAGSQPLPQTEAACGQVDLLPLVLERLDLAAPGRLEGTPLGRDSMAQVCELYRNPGNARLFGPRFDRKLSALIAGRYKLILSSREDDPDAGLYDFRADPLDSRDLSQAKPEVLEELNSLLEKWKRTLNPPLVPLRIEGVDPETGKQLEALGYGQ